MVKIAPFCFCTNNVPGQALEPALDLAARCGFTRVELASIDGISEQIDPEKVDAAYARQIANLLRERGLQCYAVSGHCDLTDPAGLDRLLKKLEFAGRIGARCLNTRAGLPERMDAFLENVQVAAEAARRWGVQLNLESYGDIVGGASQVGPVFRRPELAGIGYNYDPGNTFRFARGEIAIQEDLAAAQVKPVYFHFKDASCHDGYIWNEPLGQGQLDYPAILSALEGLGVDRVPGGLEIPLLFRIKQGDLALEFLEVSLEQVEAAVKSSVAYLSRYAKLEP